MNLLIEDVKEFSDFLIEHDLTADQFFICTLLSSELEGYVGLPEREEAISNFFKYFHTVAEHKENPVWSQQDLDDLVEKNYLKRRIGAPDDTYNYRHFEATEGFADLVFEKKNSLMSKFEDFWEEYPVRHKENGKNFNLKAVNKERIFEIYKDALEQTEHETILSALKIANSKNEVNCRIDKWLTGENWMAYLEEVESGEINEDIQQTVL